MPENANGGGGGLSELGRGSITICEVPMEFWGVPSPPSTVSLKETRYVMLLSIAYPRYISHRREQSHDEVRALFEWESVYWQVARQSSPFPSCVMVAFDRATVKSVIKIAIIVRPPGKPLSEDRDCLAGPVLRPPRASVPSPAALPDMSKRGLLSTVRASVVIVRSLTFLRRFFASIISLMWLSADSP